MVRARSPSWLDGKSASFSGAADADATAAVVPDAVADAVEPTDASPDELFPHPAASSTQPVPARPAAITRSLPVTVIRLNSFGGGPGSRITLLAMRSRSFTQ
jgi:hypothetical protein